MKLLYIIIIILPLVCSSCKSKSKAGDAIIETNLILGHRGSGGGVKNGMIENSLVSIQSALDQLDGCEIDIQLSADGTIWVYHDDLISHLCEGGQAEACVPNSTDEYLNSLLQCRDGIMDSLCTLEEVFQILSLPQYKNKILSLDVKGYFAASCMESRNAPDAYFDRMADSFLTLLKKYPVQSQLLIETNYTHFLDIISEESPQIRCHLLGYNNFEEKINKALDKGYHGISFSASDSSANASNLSRARELGLEVQLWTIYNKESLNKIKALKAFAIQIDDLNMIKTP